MMYRCVSDILACFREMYCVLCGVWFAPSFSKTTQVDTSGQSQVAEELHVDKYCKGMQLQVQVQAQVQIESAFILMSAYKYRWLASPET